MSQMLLIRHGQASFGSTDYDVLSELGVEQSCCLGRYFAETKVRFDAIYCGPRQRHHDTAAHLRTTAALADLQIPEPIVLAGLDEFPAFELVDYWNPILEREQPELASDLKIGSPRALDVVFQRWASGSLDSGHLETFAQFDQRVRHAIAQIQQREGRHRTIAVVTSGGPIVIAARYCLDLSPAKTMSLLWSITNSSMTEVRYRSPKTRDLIEPSANKNTPNKHSHIGLYSLNRTPHLRRQQITSR